MLPGPSIAQLYGWLRDQGEVSLSKIREYVEQHDLFFGFGNSYMDILLASQTLGITRIKEGDGETFVVYHPFLDRIEANKLLDQAKEQKDVIVQNAGALRKAYRDFLIEVEGFVVDLSHRGRFKDARKLEKIAKQAREAGGYKG